jgi:hypothetical protein
MNDSMMRFQVRALRHQSLNGVIAYDGGNIAKTQEANRRVSQSAQARLRLQVGVSKSIQIVTGIHLLISCLKLLLRSILQGEFTKACGQSGQNRRPHHRRTTDIEPQWRSLLGTDFDARHNLCLRSADLTQSEIDSADSLHQTIALLLEPAPLANDLGQEHNGLGRISPFKPAGANLTLIFQSTH